MGRVLTNNTGLRAVIETTPGVPPTTGWFVVERDTISEYGAVIETVVRRPISDVRGRQKGTVTSVSSSVGYGTDLTIDALRRFVEGFFFSEFQNLEFNLRASSGAVPPPATGTGYTIDAASATLAAKMVFAASGATSLVYAKGFLIAANNGVKPLTADVAAAGTLVTVSGLTAETPPTNATLHVCGLRTDDVTVTVATNGTGTLVSAADVTNWATYGLFVGMSLHVGGVDTDLTNLNTATIAAVTVYGYVRITAISGATLTFDKATTTLLAGGAGSSSGTQTIDFLFGQRVRDVAVTANATDNRYVERTYQFELSYPNLGTAGATEYEYAVGNFADEITLNLPLQSKATTELGLIGTNSDDITPTRKTGPSTATALLRNTAINTSSDLVSISTSVVSSASDVCFKSLSVTILNNVSPEYCLGTVGATFVNAGLFEVNIEGQMAFTDKSIVNSIKNNTTVTFAAILRNQDGAIALDMPELTLSGGGREFPVDQTVLVNLTGASFTSSTYGYNASVTIFPVVPIAV